MKQACSVLMRSRRVLVGVAAALVSLAGVVTAAPADALAFSGKIINGTGGTGCLLPESAKQGAWLTMAGGCSGYDGLRWSTDGTTVVDTKTGKCVDVRDGKVAYSARVVIGTCTGSTSQRWDLVDTGRDDLRQSFALRNRASTQRPGQAPLCMTQYADPAASSYNKMLLFPCTVFAPNQIFWVHLGGLP